MRHSDADNDRSRSPKHDREGQGKGDEISSRQDLAHSVDVAENRALKNVSERLKHK